MKPLRLSCWAVVPLLQSRMGMAMATATLTSKAGTGVHAPVGKDGDGAYTADTKGCFDVIETAKPLVLREIRKQIARTTGSSVYHIADYGTADGGTSMGLLSEMIKTLRQRQDESSNKEVVVHYEDQLTNEWQVSVAFG